MAVKKNYVKTNNNSTKNNKNLFYNKKAIYFSMISLLILIVLILSVKQSPYIVESQTQNFYEKRILLTTNQIDSFRKGFLEKSLEFSTYSSLKGIAEYRVRLGKNYLNKKELEDDLKNAILSGNITVCLNVGSGKNCFEDPLRKVSGYKYDFGLIKLLDNYSKLIYNAYKIKFEFPKNKKDYDIIIYQDKNTGPFYVGLNLTFSYNVSAGKDPEGKEIAVWNITETIPIKVSIEGIKDPYMAVHSGRNYNYTFKSFFSEKWNTNVFKKFVDSQAYIYDNESLSFLGRFYNSKEYQNCCGITTTINKTKYDLYHCGAIGEITNRSFVDCEYFDYTQTGITCRDKGDNIIYNITGISNNNFPFTITAKEVEKFNISNEDLNYIPINKYSSSVCPMITISPECGNNICEEGEPISGSSDYCLSDCPNYNAQCGNGIVESSYGEICEVTDTYSCTTKEGYPGTKDCLSCTSFDVCKTTLYCGDGVKNGPEQCEYTDGTVDGIPDLDCNAPYGGSCQYCDSSCTIKTKIGPYCGDGIINGNEVCDSNSRSCVVDPNKYYDGGYPGTQYCNSACTGYGACTSPYYCGDGVKNGNEQCDYNQGNQPICNTGFGGCCTVDCRQLGCFFWICS